MKQPHYRLPPTDAETGADQEPDGWDEDLPPLPLDPGAADHLPEGTDVNVKHQKQMDARHAQAQRTIARLRKEQDEWAEDVGGYDAILEHQGNLLDGVAVALRGDAPDGTSWSHHDLPERAERLAAKVARVEAVLDLIARHSEVEDGEVEFRHADTGTWWDVADALQAALSETGEGMPV